MAIAAFSAQQKPTEDRNIVVSGLIGFSHRGQRDPGETTESPAGIREMQTFRKLPMTMPNRKKKNGITDLTVPQAGQRLKKRAYGRCRMANGNVWRWATR